MKHEFAAGTSRSVPAVFLTPAPAPAGPAASPARAGALRSVLAAAILLVGAPVAAVAAPSAAGARAPAAKPSPPRAEASEGALGSAVASVAAALRNRNDYPATEEAVEFLLFLHARDHDRADLDRAGDLARRMDRTGGGIPSPQTFYEVAQAGGTTVAQAEKLLEERKRLMTVSGRATTDTFAGFVRNLFARAAALHDPEAVADGLYAAGDFFDRRTRSDGSRVVVLPGGGKAAEASFSDYVETLRAATTAVEASGSVPLRRDMDRIARQMISRFWNEKETRFDASPVDLADMPPSVVPLLNARAALALWEAGWVAGDPLLQGRAERALRSILTEALRDPETAPAAALAAAHMLNPPVLMALVGDPADPDLAGLRDACFYLFEPRKVLIGVDPAADTERMARLNLPGEPAPALRVCVEAVCSGPVTAPATVEDTVKQTMAAWESRAQ